MQYLTPGMIKTLGQLANGAKYVDVRSGMALHRRGLARWDGEHYRVYLITDKGTARLAKIKARQQVCRWIIDEKKHLDQDVIDTVMEYATWAASR